MASAPPPGQDWLRRWWWYILSPDNTDTEIRTRGEERPARGSHWRRGEMLARYEAMVSCNVCYRWFIIAEPAIWQPSIIPESQAPALSVSREKNFFSFTNLCEISDQIFHVSICDLVKYLAEFNVLPLTWSEDCRPSLMIVLEPGHVINLLSPNTDQVVRLSLLWTEINKVISVSVLRVSRLVLGQNL